MPQSGGSYGFSARSLGPVFAIILEESDHDLQIDRIFALEPRLHRPVGLLHPIAEPLVGTTKADVPLNDAQIDRSI